MIINGREIIVEDRFKRETIKIYRYYLKHTYQGAQKFLEDLRKIMQDRIAHYPTHHPEFIKLPTPGKVVRKASFKKYYLIYRIEPTRLVFISIFHFARDWQKMRF